MVKTKSRHTSNRKTKKLICNPTARKNKITKNSCFTPKAVELLKSYYNTQHPNKKILKRNPRQILREIKKLAPTTCKSDVCIINKFTKNKRDANMLKALLYPPPKPENWDDDPDAWLSNFDIMDVLNQYEKSYPNFTLIGPSSIDYDTEIHPNQFVCRRLREFNLETYLQKTPPITKIGVVFNLDPHYKGGSHWVSLFIDLEHYFIFYFDSNGNSIPANIKKFVDMVMKQASTLELPKKLEFHQNTKTEHQMTNTECGMYSLYFIITMLLREKEIKYDVEGGGSQKMTTQELFDLFKNKRIPDMFVFEKRDEYFR